MFATQRGYGEFKGGWEFPGGKIEPGEPPRDALRREIREELAIEILVGDFIDAVEHDYPSFHLSMQCYRCSVVSGDLELLEHENAAWLTAEPLRSVDWLPADIAVLDKVAARWGRDKYLREYIFIPAWDFRRLNRVQLLF